MDFEECCAFDGLRPRGFSVRHSCDRASCERSGRNAYCRSANDQRQYLAKLADAGSSSSDAERLRLRTHKRMLLRGARINLREEHESQDGDGLWDSEVLKDLENKEGYDYAEKTDAWDCSWSMASTTASFSSLKASSAGSSRFGLTDDEDEGACSSVWLRRSNGKLRPLRWEKAQIIAANQMTSYMKENGLQMGPAPGRRHERRRASDNAKEVLRSSMPSISRSIPGAPLCPHRHERVAQLLDRKSESGTSQESTAVGRSKSQMQTHGTYLVDPTTEEFAAVTNYFLFTLQSRSTKIVDLTRLQNTKTCARYFQTLACSGRPETVMFHGCRYKANEDSIIANGFQVSKCKSGGANFGTWLAYGAKYSNGGFVYQEKTGIKHIFVCAVNYQSVKRDDAIMRVVSQDCACPIWLLRYRESSWRHIPSKFLTCKHSVPVEFYHVVDGAWKLAVSVSLQR